MEDQLDLPHDVYTRLVDAAQSEGTTPVGWIANRLPQPADEKLVDPGADQPKNMLEALGDLVGSVRSGGKLRNAAERHSELFAEGLEEKRRQGRL